MGALSCSQAGDVVYTDVDKQGGGIVEFANKSDQVNILRVQFGPPRLPFGIPCQFSRFELSNFQFTHTEDAGVCHLEA